MAPGWIKKKCPEPSTRNEVPRRPGKPRLVHARALGHNRGTSEEKVNDGHCPEDRTAKDAALLYCEVRLHVSTQRAVSAASRDERRLVGRARLALSRDTSTGRSSRRRRSAFVV